MHLPLPNFLGAATEVMLMVTNDGSSSSSSSSSFSSAGVGESQEGTTVLDELTNGAYRRTSEHSYWHTVQLIRRWVRKPRASSSSSSIGIAVRSSSSRASSLHGAATEEDTEFIIRYHRLPLSSQARNTSTASASSLSLRVQKRSNSSSSASSKEALPSTASFPKSCDTLTMLCDSFSCLGEALACDAYTLGRTSIDSLAAILSGNPRNLLSEYLLWILGFLGFGSTPPLFFFWRNKRRKKFRMKDLWR
jgi:hypothetical protein